MHKLRQEIEVITKLKFEIQQEMKDNNDFGDSCRAYIKENASSRDLEKFNLVVADLQPTMSLIFGLSGRLKRCERCLRECEAQQVSEAVTLEIQQLHQKYLDLEAQIKEAQEIKVKVENRRDGLMKRLEAALPDEHIKDIEYFVTQKVHLFQQHLDMDDKLKLDEEQLRDMRLQMEEENEFKALGCFRTTDERKC